MAGQEKMSCLDLPGVLMKEFHSFYLTQKDVIQEKTLEPLTPLFVTRIIVTTRRQYTITYNFQCF